VARCPDESFREGLLELASKAVDTSSNPADALQARSALHLGLRNWKKGQADLEKAIESETANHYVHYQRALLCLVLNEMSKYRGACATLVGKFGETDDPMAANFVAWTCALAPDAVDAYEPVIACATKAVEAQPESDQLLNTLGAILYRAGRRDEAIRRLTELDQRRETKDGAVQSSPAYTWYFLAMAHHEAGHAERTREYMKKANQWTDKALAEEDNPAPWNRRATLEIFRKEAKTLLGSDAKEAAKNGQEPEGATTTEKDDRKEQGRE
jgi:tetratricopeptide (TPR) repeat protein